MPPSNPRKPRAGLLAIAAAAAIVLGTAAAASVLGDDPRPAATEAGLHRSGAPGLADLRLEDVAASAGLAFRQGAFRFGVSNDPAAMMGGGLCWLDYDDDGWLDLFVVNSYAERQVARWEREGGLPRSALFHNVKGTFVDVSVGSGADLALRGNGCVAADLDLDGRTDLFVTAAGSSALLWNDGDGTFTEGTLPAGVNASGWYSGAAAGDVNGDGLPDLFVAGYTDLNAPIPGAEAGFPNTYAGVRDRLFLNVGREASGRARFREVGEQVGLEVARFDHSLGAVLSDLDRDGDLDVAVANDEQPNRLYENVPWPGGAKADPAGLGFRFEERAASAGVADPNAGMGIAAADYDGDGRVDLFVSNSRGQAHAVFRSQPLDAGGPVFVDARADFTQAFGTSFTGWGATWVDLDLDGDLDLVLANGAIPVTNVARNAQPLQALENRGAQGLPGQFRDVSEPVGLRRLARLVGRGLAAADYDNDGDVDFAVNSIGGRLVLLRNTLPGGTWLEIRALPLGAEVTVSLPDGRELRRESRAGGSYLSTEDPRLHFGLGGARRATEVVVRWPGGQETRIADVAANQLLDVRPPR